jgi:hypothetical protein
MKKTEEIVNRVLALPEEKLDMLIALWFQQQQESFQSDQADRQTSLRLSL